MKTKHNTSVVLGDHFDSFVSSQVATGRYNNTSEVLRSGLRLLEEEEAKLVALRAALDEGRAGDLVTDFSFEAFVAERTNK